MGKLGLPAVAPPLFGYPTSRRVVKLNLSSQEGTKRKTAAALQEQLQDFYRYAGHVTDTSPARLEDDGDTFDDVARMIAPNAPVSELGTEAPPSLEAAGEEHFDVADSDSRRVRGEDTWMKKEPAEKYVFAHYGKSA